ncbi:MAG: glycosyl hydrolase family 95 catalytic domain-containing protein [Bacteroides cellulosilyticus]
MNTATSTTCSDCIWGIPISPVTTPELAQAARVVLEHRGDGATGWSMGWKLNQWARRKTETMRINYAATVKNGTLDNLCGILARALPR